MITHEDLRDRTVSITLGELAALSAAICWLDCMSGYPPEDRGPARAYIEQAHAIIEHCAGAYSGAIYGPPEEGVTA